ncbi:solute carrier organic anion transporter family member 4C1-like [Rhinoraja longicauda]
MIKGTDNPTFTLTDDPHEQQTPTSSTEKIQESPKAKPNEFEEGPCGWGTFTFDCIQRCNNPKGYLICYSLLAIVQGALVNGLVNVNLSTIEKRYNLSSSIAGLISTGYDISFCALCLFISYYGQKGHKPRWVAFSAFMLGLGSLVFCLPHFCSGLYNYGAQMKDICSFSTSNSTKVDCDSSAPSKTSSFLYLFLLGQLLHGVGGTPLYTLGTAYIDDTVPNDKTSLYIGIGSGMSVLGPAFGYTLGGQMLDIYIDFNYVSNVEIESDDSRWLGAWWIGFIFCWLLSWCMIIPLSCFPKHLPGTEQIQREKISEAHYTTDSFFLTREEFGESFKDFITVLRKMLKNSVFMCLVIASCTEGLVITGFVTFLPKYIENQFSQTASLAAIVGGATLIPGAVIGQISSGVIISKLRFLCKSMIKMALATTGTSLLFASVFIFSYCTNIPFAGVNQNYYSNITTGEIKLDAICNAHCQCNRHLFDPICGVDHVQYFSGCYAGCTNTTMKDDHQVFDGCACIPQNIFDYDASRGRCDSACNHMPMFLGLFLFAVVFTFMTSTAITTAILRCVPSSQRSFSLGINWVFVRLLGAIPGPIIFGTVIDKSCIIWNEDECGNQGACWTYNNPKMALLFIAIGTTCKVITIITLAAAHFLYKPPRESLPSNIPQAFGRAGRK